MLAASDVLGTGWFAADAAQVKTGATVAVVGDGAVGLLAVLSAKQMGEGLRSDAPARKVAEGYRAMDERRATKTLLKV